MPLISVIMPVYNAGDYLKEATQSIINQSFTDFEFLIINDGSTDRSEEIILEFKDPRIRYIKNENNLGLIATLNKGLALAKGEYLARMDADDYSEPTRFEKQLTLFKADPELGIAGTQAIRMNMEDEGAYAEHHESILCRMFYECPFVHTSIMIRREKVNNTILFYHKDFSHAEDYELYSRLAFLVKMANHPEKLVKYRLHEGSVSYKNKATQLSNTILIKQNYYRLWNIEVNIDDIALMDCFFYKDWSCFKDMHSVQRLHTILELIIKNGESKGYPELVKELKNRWFHLCYNVNLPDIKKYWKNSGLEVPVSWKHRLIWSLKQ